MSIEGSDKVMPVRMSVAEFVKDEEGNLRRNENYDGKTLGIKEVSKLSPDKPVWVVVHGRENSENSSQILELTRNLKELDIQVVTLDWHQGAADNDIPFVGLEGSKWIEATGSWAADQLRQIGFASNNINVIGHSWGSYVAYEIGVHLPNGVQTLVALDPAADTPLLGGGKYKGFNDPHFSFSNVTQNSYAFHSSNLGHRQYALSAKYAFELVVPENYESTSLDTVAKQLLLNRHYALGLGLELIDETKDALREHGFAVSIFSEMLRRQKEEGSNETGIWFSLDHLRSNTSEFKVRDDHFEGVFVVEPSKTKNTIGSEKGIDTWKASKFLFLSKDIAGNDIYTQ